MPPYAGPRTKFLLTTGAEAYIEGATADVLEELRDANGFASLQQTGGVPLHIRPEHVLAVSPMPDA